MANSVTSVERWKAFYKTAAQFRDAAPWRWLRDRDIFGVRNPETDEIGWCCVMGAGGQHYALAVYDGNIGLQNYWHLATTDPSTAQFNPEYRNAGLCQKGWMVAFEDANMVYPQNKKHLKALGLSFRGSNQWIVATSLDPGLYPWPLEENQLPFVQLCLEQAMVVAEAQKGQSMLHSGDLFLVREQNKADGTWSNAYMDPDDFLGTPSLSPIKPSEKFNQEVKAMKRIKGCIVLANFLSTRNIEEKKGEQPQHPCVLLAIQYGSGYILAQEMIQYSKMAQSLENFLLRTFRTIKGVPMQIAYHHPPIGELLEDIAEKYDIELVEIDGDEDTILDVAEAFAPFL